MARYAVLRIGKVKTMGHVAGLGLHVERERETRNADEARRQANERLALLPGCRSGRHASPVGKGGEGHRLDADAPPRRL